MGICFEYRYTLRGSGPLKERRLMGRLNHVAQGFVSGTKLAGSGLIVDTCKASVEELIKVKDTERKRKGWGEMVCLRTNTNVCQGRREVGLLTSILRYIK